MAKDLNSLFSSNKRKTPELDLTPEAPQVVARDFNLFYKSEEAPVDPTIGVFLKSLDNFVNQAGTKMVMAKEKKLKDVGEAEAKKQRVESQKSFKKAVEAGEIDENANPYLIDKYKELDLNAKARKFQENLYKQYEKLGVSEDNSEGAFERFYNSQLEKFIKENEIASYDALTLNNGFFKKTDAIRNGLNNTHQQTQLSKIGANYKKSFKENIIGAIENNNNGDEDNIENIGKEINKLIKDNLHLRDGTKLRDFVLEGVEEWITNTNDFEYAEDVLDYLMQYVDGGTAPFEKIGVVKNKIDRLREVLLKEKNSFEKENVDSYNNSVNVGKANVRETITDLVSNPEFNYYEWTKTDAYLNLKPEVKKEADTFYTSLKEPFATTTSTELFLEIHQKIREGNLFNNEGNASDLLNENRRFFSKSDFISLSKKIDIAFFTTGDPLRNHPSFKDFDEAANTWLRNTMQSFEHSKNLKRYGNWRTEIFEWMADHPLKGEEFNGNKTKRKDAFKIYVDKQLENFSLTGLEEEFDSSLIEEDFKPPKEKSNDN
jgi:hypothetical protein